MRTLTEGLRQEVKPHRIRTTIISPGAVATELVHNFSLVHDDIIDGDTMRRHRPTVWSAFGVEDAVISGDALHNLAYQGVFPAETLSALDLGSELLSIDGLEFWNQVSFLKGGINFADAVTTVSATYAREILTPQFGMGLDGVLAGRASNLTGILNGIDLEAWNPKSDPALTATYGLKRLGAKAKNRVGPVLNGIVDGPAGAVEDFRYSKPMAAAAEAGLVWTESELSAFLGNPKGYMKGTKMSFPGVRKEEDIDALIAYLRDASE